MEAHTKTKFFDRVENRLIVTLILSVAYPVVLAAFFPVFVFLILPALALAFPALVLGPLLYYYWLASALAWLLLLGLILPQMRKDIRPAKKAPDSPSEINLKRMTLKGSCDLLEETENLPSKRSSSLSSKSAKSHQRLDSSKNAEDDALRIDNDEYKFSFEDSDVIVHTPKEDSDSDEGRSPAEKDPVKKVLHSEEVVSVTTRSPETLEALQDETVATETVVTRTTTTRRVEMTSSSSTAGLEQAYEYSLPSPTLTDTDESKRNTVFIYVKKDEEE